jgi:hypothetical protein
MVDQSRREFLRLSGTAAIGTLLGAHRDAFGEAAPKGTDSVLILYNKKGELNPLEISVNSMPEIPKGFEWAKQPTEALIEGFKKIRGNEKKLIGKNAVFEAYGREGGVFLLSEDGNFNGKSIDGDSNYSYMLTDKGAFPLISFKAPVLKREPENAAFYTGHELGHHFNFPPRLTSRFSPQEIKDLNEKVLVHSAHPLFGMATNFDMFDSARQGKINESLPSFTERRESDPVAMADQVLREREEFADAVGTVLSGVHPHFPWNKSFQAQQPLNAPLVKQYVEDMVMQDVLLRSSPSPVNARKEAQLYDAIVDPRKVAGEAGFSKMGTIEDSLAQKLEQGQPLPEADLRQAQEIMKKTLDGFHKSRLELSGTPARQ